MLAREALESLSSAIALVDERGVIGDLNAQLTCLSGYATNDLLGKNIRLIVPNLRPDSPLLSGTDWTVETNEMESWTDDTQSIRCRDGSSISISLNGSPLSLDGQRWTLIVLEDTTSQKRAEAARLEAESRSRKANNDFVSPSRETWLPWSLATERGYFSKSMIRTVK